MDTRRGFLRRTLATAALSSVAAPLARGAVVGPSGDRFSSTAFDLVACSPVIDMMGLLTTDWPRVARWQSAPAGFSAEDDRAVADSGVALFHPAARLRGDDQPALAQGWLEGWARFADFHPRRFLVVRTEANWRAVRSGARQGLLLGMQDSAHFESAADVERFARIGQRLSQLTYNGRNQIGGGCALARDPGLSKLGGDVVAEMNRVGMIIDVSHCGQRTTLDAFKASRRPVLITHSNCAALTPGSARCKSDEEIRRMAAGGGVMGVTAIRAFVRAGGRARFEHVLDHFDHVARLVGVEHVGLGSDAGVLGLQRNVAPGFGRVDSALRLADGLLSRGYSPADVALMLGGNFARVLSQHLLVAERNLA